MRIAMYLVVALVGCDGAALSSHAQEVAGCDDMTCSNSPEIMSGGFHELNLHGLRNAEGFSIETSAAGFARGTAQIRKGGRTYDLRVENGRMRGTSATGWLQSIDLIGADIQVHKDGQEPFALHIAGVRTVEFPFGGGTFETYHITMHAVGAPLPQRAVCRQLASGAPGFDALLGMHLDEVVVFEGDRYDRTLKTVGKVRDDEWINFGCAGFTLAKLYLMRETSASAVDLAATWYERQAMFKMLAADYCGSGRAFTIAGEPLVWKGGLVSHALPPLGLEARWNASGAICVGTPRLDVYPDPQGRFSPEVMDDVVAECPTRVPPPCANMDPEALDGALVVSGNRPQT